MYVPPAKFQKHVRVNIATLRRWADTGRIESMRTPGGHRLYKLPSKEAAEECCEPTIGECVVYVRVSSSKQKDDLERQRSFMLAQRPGSRVIHDVGSGINWKRHGLLSILDGAFKGDISEVVVYSRDRLSRLGFDIIEWVLNRHGCKVTVVNAADQSPEEELSDDLMSIVQVFCCRRNGRRRYRSAEASDQDAKGETQPDKRTKRKAEDVC